MAQILAQGDTALRSSPASALPAPGVVHVERAAQQISLRVRASGIAMVVRTQPGESDPTASPQFATALRGISPHFTRLRHQGDTILLLNISGAPMSECTEEVKECCTRLLAQRTEESSPVCQIGIGLLQEGPDALLRSYNEAMIAVNLIQRLSPDTSEVGRYDELVVPRLLRHLADTDPQSAQELLARTVWPLLSYDEQHGVGLLLTLETWLAAHCSTDDTAKRLFVHRHTVHYRLQKIYSLTGRDPRMHDDREALSLGIKLHRLTY